MIVLKKIMTFMKEINVIKENIIISLIIIYLYFRYKNHNIIDIFHRQHKYYTITNTILFF